MPASDLTDSHLEHFFFTGADGAPSAIVGREIQLLPVELRLHDQATVTAAQNERRADL